MKTYAKENEEVLKHIGERHHNTNLHPSMDIDVGDRTSQTVVLDVDLET